MNLTNLFNMQRELGKVGLFNYQESDRFDKLILALLVEIGEGANFWRGFKYWSTDQQPRTKAVRNVAMMEEDKEYYNPLLEEFVDKIHFSLELGIIISMRGATINNLLKHKTVVEQYLELYEKALVFRQQPTQYRWLNMMQVLLGLGEMLGFTWEEIEQAYQIKHAINIQRQASGY